MKHLLSLTFSAILLMATSAQAVSYNFLADGAHFDIEGMLDCDVALSQCTQNEISNWMFTQIGGGNDGLTWQEGVSGINVFTFDGQMGTLFIESFANPSANLTIGIDSISSTRFQDGFNFDITLLTSFTITEKVTNPTPVPEPASVILFTSGLAGLAGYRWYHRRCKGVQVS